VYLQQPLAFGLKWRGWPLRTVMVKFWRFACRALDLRRSTFARAFAKIQIKNEQTLQRIQHLIDLYNTLTPAQARLLVQTIDLKALNTITITMNERSHSWACAGSG
jgi:hypothetical protein